MKRLTTAAMLAFVLAPVLALADDSTATEPGDSPVAQTAPSTTPPADPKADPKAAAKTDPKAGTQPTQNAQNNPLANAVQARTPEEQANQSGFQLQTSLDHYLGMGTLVSAQYYSYLAGSLTVAPTYLFAIGKQRLVASATIRLIYEYTLPDAETGRRWTFWDTRVGVSAPAFWRDPWAGIAFSPSLSLTIPTSPESWNAGMITNIGAGITMSRSVKTVDFRASVSGSRGFFAQPFNGVRNPNYNATTPTRPVDNNDNLLVVCRSNEQFCGFSNWNTAWTMAFGGQVQWRATGSLLFYVGYTFIKSWRYAATYDPNDPYNPQGVTANGDPVARVGLGQGDRTSAFFGASYQLNEHYSLDLGVSTIQTPLTATGQVRFPFLSFGAWADNATSLYFTLSAAY